MAKFNWICPACGAPAGSKEEKIYHLKRMISDPDHEIIPLEAMEELVELEELEDYEKRIVT